MARKRTLTIHSEFLEDVLHGRKVMLCDGGMGTLIQQAGLADIHEVPDLLDLTHPDEICALQRQYVEAGSDCIATNTFNANRIKLAGSGHTVAEVYEAAARIAREAGAKLVAGDIGPSGALLAPMGEMSFDEAYDIFAEQARAAENAGCDLIFLETFADLVEAKAALLTCLENTAIPVFATMTFALDGRTFMGTTPAIAGTTLSSLGANAVGLNCSVGPFELSAFVHEMAPYARCPLMAQPNAGLPRVAEDGTTVFDVSAEDFCMSMEHVLAAGATVVGGCCGTTPAHIAALRALIDSRNWLHNDDETADETPSAYRPSFIVTSAQSMVELEHGSSDIAVIGERINPTGRPRLKEALLKGDFDMLVSEAVAQARSGADILDVNVGVAGIDEAYALAEAAQRLQASVSTPLQLDSGSPGAIERACRLYAGRPLINSVNGKTESLESILPIAAHYGASIVGLTLDENGIPSSTDERVAIARRIVEAALVAGIPREDIAIDCLVMAAATNQAEVPQILLAMRRCKEELGVRCVLGVSNVSFGLPDRAVLNASFLTAALASGLDLPILNPLEPRYQDAIRSFKVINGQDEGCLEYVAAYSGVQETRSDDTSACGIPRLRAFGSSLGMTEPGQRDEFHIIPSGHPHVTPSERSESRDPSQVLFDAVVTGQRSIAGLAAKQALETMDPISIAGDILSPALDVVGERYDKGAYFLPQLMASAEAAKAAFDVLSEVQESTGAAMQAVSESPIVIATVEGDVHDIGKNIVRMLLENYGFKVIDLGKNVAPQVIVDAVRESGAQLVGLSALMTTTLGAMERTIELLQETGCDASVMVGGAVLNEEYAQRIGADFCAKDAQASVRIAQELLS